MMTQLGSARWVDSSSVEIIVVNMDYFTYRVDPMVYSRAKFGSRIIPTGKPEISTICCPVVRSEDASMAVSTCASMVSTVVANGTRKGVTPQYNPMRWKVRGSGVKARMGTLGRALAINSAVRPDSVKTAIEATSRSW